MTYPKPDKGVPIWFIHDYEPNPGFKTQMRMLHLRVNARVAQRKAQRRVWRWL